MTYIISCLDCKNEFTIEYSDLLILKALGNTRVSCNKCNSINVKVNY